MAGFLVPTEPSPEPLSWRGLIGCHSRSWLLALLLLVLIAASLRLTGVAWDGGVGAHPDERALVGLAETLRWPDRLNPFALDPAFSYGHLPLALIALLGGGDRLMAARLLAGLFDTGTVALTAALGRRIAGARAGGLAAAFVAVMPLHVQQAHFATVDPFLSFFVLGALLFAVRGAEGGGRLDMVLAGGWAGLAVGCKATAAFLILPLVTACTISSGAAPSRRKRGLLCGAAAVVAFAVSNPFVLLDPGRFAANLAAQAAIVRGATLVPYTLQYRGTLPYLYPMFQQMAWGMGPALGLLAFGGLGLALWRAFQSALSQAEWITLVWALPFFAFMGALFAKFPRYLLPLTPLLMVCAAQSVTGGGWPLSGKVGRWTRGLTVAVAVIPATVLSLSLLASYHRPHPWLTASEWIRTHLSPGSVIAVEDWDHPLPVDASGYEQRVLPLFEEETEQKWARMEEMLSEADAIVVASRRGYGALIKWSDRFPQTAAYYRDLFSGRIGWQQAQCFERWLRVGGVLLADDPLGAADLPAPARACQPSGSVLYFPSLDESFVVYDRPLTVILYRSDAGGQLGKVEWVQALGRKLDESPPKLPLTDWQSFGIIQPQ